MHSIFKACTGLHAQKEAVERGGIPEPAEREPKNERRSSDENATGRSAWGCFNSTTRGYTMPAFTFEKIAPPARNEPSSPIASAVRRGAIVRFLDRLTSARLQKPESSIHKVQRLKLKYRKHRPSS
jgi:hypothetical protein